MRRDTFAKGSEVTERNCMKISLLVQSRVKIALLEMNLCKQENNWPGKSEKYRMIPCEMKGFGIQLPSFRNYNAIEPKFIGNFAQNHCFI